MNFRTGALYEKLSGKRVFHENWLSYSYTLLHDVSEFLPILPTFLGQFRCNSVKKIST